jgi:hypothetical protein
VDALSAKIETLDHDALFNIEPAVAQGNSSAL